MSSKASKALALETPDMSCHVLSKPPRLQAGMPCSEWLNTVSFEELSLLLRDTLRFSYVSLGREFGYIRAGIES